MRAGALQQPRGAQALPACQRRQQQCRRRLPPLPPAACASSRSPSSSGNGSSSDGESRHFLRPSLLATGLTQPEDVLQHCLALYRKADLPALRRYLPARYAGAVALLPSPGAAAAAAAAGTGAAAIDGSSGPSRAPPLPVGPWLTVVEPGPLAPLAGVLDVGARRVLPGHLLRRSQVLSTLRPGADVFQQRVALTACTGETSVFDWLLRWHLADEEDEEAAVAGAAASTESSSSSGSSGRWVLESVRRDPSSDLPLPTTPHPKCAPEAIVRAQLGALQRGDIMEACLFSSWRSGGGGGGGRAGSRRTGLAFHLDALATKLEREPYTLLLHHAAAQLGAAALASVREQYQEVSVMAADGASERFLWRLGMGAQGCWMVTGIWAGADLEAPGWQEAPHV